MLRSTLFCLALIGSISFSGCLLTHTTHTVIRESEPLQPVTFQSEATRNTFENFVQDALNNDSNQSQSAFAIPFLLGLQKSSKTSENAVRNDAIARFDVNGDRYISDYEISLN